MIYSLLMNFMVQHRDSSGAMREERIEATSRTQCVAECRRRGISPVAIREGDAADKRTKVARCNGGPRRNVVWRLVGVVAVLCMALIIAWLLQKNDAADNSKSRHVSRRIKEVESVKKSVGQATEQVAEKPSPTIDVSPAKDEQRQLTPEEIEAEERRKDPLYDRHHIVAKMPLVKEPIEQLMLTVFTTELGDMPPMLPAIPAFDEEKFEKLAALRDTQKEEGDSEEVLISKDIVNAVKKELAKYLKEGGTTSGFLSYYVNELDKAFQEREMCKSLQMKSMKTDDPEVARDVYLKFNERLSAKGIKPLTLTRRQKEYLGIEE